MFTKITSDRLIHRPKPWFMVFAESTFLELGVFFVHVCHQTFQIPVVFSDISRIPPRLKSRFPAKSQIPKTQELSNLKINCLEQSFD